MRRHGPVIQQCTDCLVFPNVHLYQSGDWMIYMDPSKSIINKVLESNIHQLWMTSVDHVTFQTFVYKVTNSDHSQNNVIYK